MKLTTARFGEIEVDPQSIVTFPDGLLGFEECKRFVILDPKQGSPFRWLQCLDDGSLAFVVIEPLNFMFEYDLEIGDHDEKALGLTRAEDVCIYVIVTIPAGKPQEMTANLQGPLVINVANQRGRQVVSGSPAHGLRASIVAEMARREKKLAEIQASLAPAADAKASPTANPAGKEDRG